MNDSSTEGHEMFPRARNFVDVVNQRMAGVPDYITNGEFLDAFYASPQGQRQSFIDSEPPYVPSVPQQSYALFAAIAEELALEYQLQVPPWTKKPCYFLADENAVWGGLKSSSQALRDVLKEQSPSAFAKRNIYVSANILSRT